MLFFYDWNLDNLIYSGKGNLLIALFETSFKSTCIITGFDIPSNSVCVVVSTVNSLIHPVDIF